MMSLHTLFKYKHFETIKFLVVFALAAYILVFYSLDWWVIAALIFYAAMSYLGIKRRAKQRQLQASIMQVVIGMHSGNLEARVIGIDLLEKTSLGAIGNALNSGLDQTETFIREVKTVLEHAKNNRFYRHTMPIGLHGVYASALGDVDVAINNLEKGYWDGKKESMIHSMDKLRSERLIDNLIVNQSDLKEMTDDLEQVEKISVEAADMASTSERSVLNLLSNLDHLINSIHEMRQSSKSLDDSSKEIQEVTKFIAGVAEKTNLLALNAAIEAARAGEVGRGFAVVADEVRHLAEETTQATDNISRIINQLVDSSSQIYTKTENMYEVSEKSHEAFSSFKSDFERLSEISADTKNIVSKERLIAFGALAKADHILYVQKAYRTHEVGVDSQEAKDVDVTEKECRFGKWLADDSFSGGKQYENSSDYKNILEPHKIVHMQARKAVESFRSDWEKDDNAQQNIISSFQELEDASKKVMNLIDKMVRTS